MARSYLSDSTTSFQKRQEQYYSDILGRKWECAIAGHTVCVPTQDGRHRQLNEQDMAEWVNSLCVGECTTGEPPVWIMNGTYDPAAPISDDGVLTARAVFVPPSRAQNRRETRGFTFQPRAERPPPSSVGSKALKWIGDRSLYVVEEAIIMRCGSEHRARLRQWQRPGKGAEDTPGKWAEKRGMLLPILADALEMSRTCYSLRVNKSAYLIGTEVQQWLKVHPTTPFTKDIAAWFALAQICLLPLLLSRISRTDPFAGDISWALIEFLRRAWLHLQDSRYLAPALCTLLRELTYSPHAFAQHAWLGLDLRSVVSTVLKARRLTDEELDAVREMADRRLDQNNAEDPRTARPWEVAILADCAAQDPAFRALVLGPHGLPSVHAALRRTLARFPPAHADDPAWEHAAHALRSLAFLGEHAWAARAIETELVLRVFRDTTLPERWACIRLWGMEALRNIGTHHPAALAALDMAPPPPSPSSSASLSPTTPTRTSYRREADACARDIAAMLVRARRDASTSTMTSSSSSSAGDLYDVEIPARLSLSGPAYETELVSPLTPMTPYAEEEPWVRGEEGEHVRGRDGQGEGEGGEYFWVAI